MVDGQPTVGQRNQKNILVLSAEQPTTQVAGCFGLYPVATTEGIQVNT